MHEQYKRKIPSYDEIPRMDRGGVEPLEQSDNFAPETARTQPSRPRSNGINTLIKRKAPLRELFGDRAVSIKAELSLLPSLYSLQKVCQVLIRTGLIALFLSFIFLPQSYTFAQTSTSTEALIHQLESQIKTLQTRINELEIELGVKPATPASPEATQPSSEISAGAAQDKQLPTFTATLSLGSRGDDVRNLQQFLAKDKEVYPEGLITAYYGPLTEKAVKKFQEKHQIISSGASETTGYGRIGPKTRSKLNELLAEGAGKSGMIPPGLTKAPELQDKIATPPLPSGQATTTPSRIATTTPSGTISATPAQPIGHTGTTTVPATPAQPAGGQGTTTPPPSTTPPPPPPPSGTTPPPSPTPSPTPSPSPTPPPSGTDTTAPTISNVQATNITTLGATITWTTNESADGKVEYGLTASYGSSFASTTFATSQSIRISGLQSNTTYHYRVISKDVAGNAATSGDYMFTTLAVSSPPPPPPSTGTAGTQKWAFNAGQGLYSSSPALAADGTIYVGVPSLGNKLYAVDSNGISKWSFATDSGILASPTVASDGTIYVGTVYGKFYAINSNGTQKWVFDTVSNNKIGTIRAAAAIATDGTIYVSAGFENARGITYAINPDGTQKWSYPVGVWAHDYAPAIANDGTVYVNGSSSFLALNPDGTLKWSQINSNFVTLSPAIDDDGTVYVAAVTTNPSWQCKLYAFNSNGTTKWTYPCINNARFDDGSVVIGANGILYVPDESGKLHAFTRSGVLKWSFATLGQIALGSGVVGANGTIYVGSFDDYLYAINPDGTKKWNFQTGANVGMTPAIASDGTIYIGSEDGKLYAIYTDSQGLANSPWPKYQKNNRNTGNASDPVALQKTSQPALALILQSLSATLDDIQKQIQKLAR